MDEPASSASCDGYLVLADISGYTEFLTGTELEHSHAIVRELTRLIRERLAPPLRFVKLEGDAVFCYSEPAAFADGERIVELIEACYFDFSNRLLDMTRSTTCRCDACASIGALDLKFVVHYGSFMTECDEDGRIDLCGPEVILVHRLLKNTIVEDGEPSAYAFLSDACLAQLPSGIDLPRHREHYESFGETSGGVHDLAAVAEQRREEQRVRISEADADVETGYEVAAPPSVVWQYFVDPEKRIRLFRGFETGITFSPNEKGRLGAGATSHCVHGVGGDALREYLDWRPYEYFTCRFTPLPNDFELMPPSVETFEFIPIADGGTSIRWRIRALDRSDEGLAVFEVTAGLIRELASAPDYGDPLRNLLGEDTATFGLDDRSAPHSA